MSEGHNLSGSTKRPGILLTLVSFSRRQKITVGIILLIFIISLLLAIGEINRHFTVKVRASGGHVVEGIIGTPRFINPLLASSDADRDLSSLIYSGLMRISEDGQPIPDLAATYQISDDQLHYTFTLREGLTWQDGEPVQADDIEFTIKKAQDPLLKSPRRAGWEGVEVRAIDELTIGFDLEQIYPAFLENATMGILPKHLWERFDTEAFSLNQFNSESIGSGPYQIKSIKKDGLGIPEYYILEPFRNFALGSPKISKLTTKFYPNQDNLMAAYRRAEISSMATVPAAEASRLEEAGIKITKVPLPRVFAVFFNQNHAPMLANIEVRKALDLVIDKQEIINSVLHGYGGVARGPIPFLINPTEVASTTSPATESDEDSSAINTNIETARDMLTRNDWKWNEEALTWTKSGQTLSLSLATANAPELKQATEIIKQNWEKLGVKVELKVFELGDLNQNIIRPRQYDAVFFGEILGRNPDPFPFWHSKHRLDPGLNIALYTNTRADNLLDKIRITNDREQLLGLYQEFNSLVLEEAPAIFIYYPHFLYVSPVEVQNFKLIPINTAADRFLNIHNWYIKTDRVWGIFANDNNQLDRLKN